MTTKPQGMGGESVRPVTDDALSREFAPWHVDEATDEERAAQAARIARLRERGHAIGADCFVATSAAVRPDHLELGDRSCIAAHAQVSGTVALGADTTVNVAATGSARGGRVGARGRHATHA